MVLATPPSFASQMPPPLTQGRQAAAAGNLPQTALRAASPLCEERAFGWPLVNHARPMIFSSPAPSIWLTVASCPFQNTAQLLNTHGSAFAASSEST